jgi:hypothetical protein
LELGSDLSLATKEGLDVLREDTDRNHSTTVKEIQAMSRIVNTVQAEISQQLPISSEKLYQQIQISGKSIETIISRSSDAVSHLIKAEIDQRFPLLEESVVSSVTQDTKELKSKMEVVVAASNADIKHTLESRLDMLTRQQTEFLAPMRPRIAGNTYSEREYLQSPLSVCQLPRSRRLRKSGQYPSGVKVSGCICSPDIGQTNSWPSFRGGIAKESERFVIHERSCPLWYNSRVNTKWRIDFFLYRLRIFGTLSTTRSPHTPFFGWSISPNLTCRMTVADDAPAFEVLNKYRFSPDLLGDENWTISCIQELRTVFISGQGSPYDTLSNGVTLIEVSHFKFSRLSVIHFTS